MSVPSSGAVSFSDISNTLGGGNPISMSEYFKETYPSYASHLSVPYSNNQISVSQFRNATRNNNLFSSISNTSQNYYSGGVAFQVQAKNSIAIDRITTNCYSTGTTTLTARVYYRKGSLTDTNAYTTESMWVSSTPYTFTLGSGFTNISIPITIGIKLNANETASIYVYCFGNTMIGGPLYNFTSGNTVGGTTTSNSDIILQQGRAKSNNTNGSSPFSIDSTTGVDFTGTVTYTKPPLYAFTSHTFTNASATGRTGPTLAQCTSAYSATSWATNTSYFNVVTQGIQIWTVPMTGAYTFETAGAASGTTYNGSSSGVLMVNTNVILNQNDKLYIVVGQTGSFGGGGGATWVFLNSVSTSSLLFVAGGGGGAGYNAWFGIGAPGAWGISGQTSTTATDGQSSSYSGGSAGTDGGGGGGAFGQLANGSSGGNNGTGGNAPATGTPNKNRGGSGGAGGGNITSSSTFLGGTGGGAGGFGGGGGSAGTSSGWGIGGGGGGGYNGGGGGSGASNDNDGGAGGGGGSSYYITTNGTLQSWTATNYDMGYVRITKQ